MSAPNSCDPCNTCNPPKWQIDAWHQAVIAVLCQILGALPGPGGAEPVPLPDEVKAYTFFTNAYQALGLVDVEKKISHLVITNNSDGDYAISFNNSDENYRVLANTYKVIDFDGANVTLATDVYAKYVVAPSQGSVIFEAYYYA